MAVEVNVSVTINTSPPDIFGDPDKVSNIK